MCKESLCDSCVVSNCEIKKVFHAKKIMCCSEYIEDKKIFDYWKYVTDTTYSNTRKEEPPKKELNKYDKILKSFLEDAVSLLEEENKSISDTITVFKKAIKKAKEGLSKNNMMWLENINLINDYKKKLKELSKD